MMRGTGASSGIGIGKAVVVRDEKPEVVQVSISDKDKEVKRFEDVLAKITEATMEMAESLANKVGGKEAEILNGHVLLLSDPMLSEEIKQKIQNELVNAEFAVDSVYDMYAGMFASMDDELMQQRATDMKDLKVRILKGLLGMADVDVARLPEGSILVAEDLTPSMTAGLNPQTVYGIVTELGGRTSHSAILSRALEIPAVVAISGLLENIHDGDTVCFDGDKGEVVIRPDADTLAEYEKKKEAYLLEKKELENYKGKPSVTKDGRKVEIVANIGKPEDAQRALEYDAEGVGLFRTEFLFMDRDNAPTEEEQFEAYKKVATLMKDKPVIIRTLDIGGDKEIPYLGIEQDENPFLGYRAIRLCLDRKEDLYRPQLRALLRASAFGDIRIMIPLITCVDEIREAKALIREIMEDLDRENIAYNKDIQVGIMIETAASSIMADVFAKEVDFFSIGTNDLTQYTMCVDRGNAKVSYLYSPLNPAVLRSLKRVITSAKEAGIMVGMCGEAAADPLLIPLLLVWGLDEFSMSASSILKSRKLVTNSSIADLEKIEKEVMKFTTEKEVREYMEKVC
ncbi:phosphoenolpyruvate--protein phosphotransferase [Lachnospiraceae bacterium oral taxon 096]|nr:phosphoenolpyruvate--protein phosphotransferase [Lachnospiraceae bacterium oral taxon 096]QUI96775.1 phosphoenolpyruvate--protein phosphotransferase [Lachnospiraceae bacterium oral taxon 096]